MGNYRMVMIFQGARPKNVGYDEMTAAIKELTWEYETSKRARFKENPTCSLAAPIGYREEENYEFTDISAFDVEERGRWAECLCKKCETKFSFPIPRKKCLACDSEELEYQGRGIGKLVVNAKERARTWEPDQANIDAARKDIENNPTPGSEGFDWGGLKQTMDNTDYTGRSIDPSLD